MKADVLEMKNEERSRANSKHNGESPKQNEGGRRKNLKIRRYFLSPRQNQQKVGSRARSGQKTSIQELKGTIKRPNSESYGNPRRCRKKNWFYKYIY